MDKWEKLGDDFLDHLSAKLAQLFESTTMEIGQLVIIKPQEMKQGNVKVSNGMHTFDRFRTKVVRRTHDTGFDSTTCHEHGHGLVIVSTSDGIDPSPFVIVGCSTEFARPDHQSLVQ